jgi:hypothetical protein
VQVDVSSGSDYGNQLATPPPPAPKKRRRKKPAAFPGAGSLGTLSGAGGKAPPAAAAKAHRPKLLHQRPVPLGVPLPRVTTAELDSGSPQFAPFKDRQQPFVLTDGLVGWGALAEWPAQWRELLPQLFPEAVTDFYP